MKTKSKLNACIKKLTVFLYYITTQVLSLTSLQQRNPFPWDFCHVNCMIIGWKPQQLNYTDQCWSDDLCPVGWWCSGAAHSLNSEVCIVPCDWLVSHICQSWAPSVWLGEGQTAGSDWFEQHRLNWLFVVAAAVLWGDPHDPRQTPQRSVFGLALVQTL